MKKSLKTTGIARWTGRWASALLSLALIASIGRAAAETVVYKGASIEIENATHEVLSESGDLLIKFTDTSAAGSFKLPGPAKAWILAVGGGGAGGTGTGTSTTSGVGGGGGAGGFCQTGETERVLLSVGTYAVTVGQGGIRGTDKVSSVGSNGWASVVSSSDFEMRAFGGGGGGYKTDGNAGGSGGGGSRVGSKTSHKGGAGIAGQGHAGGDDTKSKVAKTAGGGGGAGGPGGSSASLNIGANGGAGKASNITGVTGVMYAGGGGSGTYNGIESNLGQGCDGGGNGAGGTTTEPIAAEDGDPGTGGGGGGGSLICAGGAGGSGIVLVRLSDALAGSLEVPQSVSLVYNGKEQIGVQDSVWYTMSEDSVPSATDAGTYVVKVTPIEGVEWSTGGSDEKTVVWTIKPMSVSKPTAPTGLTYNGSNQIGATQSVCYAFLEGSVTNATDAGTRTFTVRLNNTVSITNFVWAGESTYPALLADVSVEWTIAPKKIAVPVPRTGLVYNGKNQLAFDPATLDLVAYGFTKESETNAVSAGPHEFTAVFNNPEGITNYVWSLDPETSEPYAGEWTIFKAANAITSLALDSWKTGTTPSDPVLKSTWGAETALYSWATSSGAEADWSAEVTKSGWRAAAPTETGNYYLKARVPETSDWEETESVTTTFSLWDNPTNFFADHVVITVTNTSTTTYTDCKVILTLAENSPAGFSYARAGSDGTQLSVLEVDDVRYPEEGTLLAYVANPWDVNGTSKLEVCVPKLKGRSSVTLILYWTLKEGKTAPAAPAMPSGATEQTAVSSSYGLVERGGETVNYWVTEPSLSPTSWEKEETPTILLEKGALAQGAVTNYIYCVTDPTKTFERVEDTFGQPGRYAAVFDSATPEKYASVYREIEFRILEHQPYWDVGGPNKGDSGRILLMNADIGDATHPAVASQGYSDTSATLSTFWQLLNSDAISTYNLQAGSESILWTANYQARLWHILNCRHGNTFPRNNDSTALAAGQCYLNWSSTSRRITDSSRKARRREVGQIVMRNTADACVYSSCFTNGIGTIYFDAVNAFVDASGDDYKIVAEIATNAVVDGVLLPPTDENAQTVDGETGATNFYGNIKSWIPVSMVPYKKDGTADFVRGEPTNELALAVQNGGTVDNFYRIVIPLDLKIPVRFRIRRTSYNADKKIDATGFILLDNIIASYPAMGAELGSSGVYDSARGGKQTLGWQLQTTVPFPSVGAKDVYPRATASYYVNEANWEAKTEEFVSAATLHYRWRYLNELSNDWQTVALNPSKGFVAMSPLELPGSAGDVEYWYDIDQRAPYYEYVDYSGSDLGVPGYSEERSSVTNHLTTAELLAYGALPSCGTDWFFRLREGKSEIESLNLYWNTNGATEKVEMELVGNGVWRGYVKTVTAAGTMNYRFEALNRQESGDLVPSGAVEYYCGKKDATSLPVSVDLVKCTASDMSVAPHTAAAGYLMFKFDENTMGVTIAAADYQNFNGWNDAKGSIFVGTSEEDDKKSAVSSKMREYDQPFATWTDTPATNALWTESFFDTRATEDGWYFKYGYNDYALNTTFGSANTLNGWNAGQGMFIPGVFQDPNKNAGVALQMQGQGKGFIQFVNGSESPRGLESISFGARVGQFIEFEDFNYSFADMTLTNYMFVTRAAFDLNENKNFSGAAALSVIACYVPKKGCYEARWEQLKASGYDSKTKQPTGIDLKSQRLCLYRWRATASGMKATLLGAVTNNNSMTIPKTTTSESASYLPLYISVENIAGATRVQAGARTSGMAASTTITELGRSSFYTATYLDTASDRLTSGTFGVLSANCEGVFVKPMRCTKPATWVGTQASGFKGFTWKTTTFSTTAADYKEEYANLNNGYWAIGLGRMQLSRMNTTHLWGVEACIPTQKVNVYVGTAGSSAFPEKPVASLDVVGFGKSTSSGTAYSIPLYTTKDASVKIAVGGTFEDVRQDVVIDDIVLRQWRGDDYGSSDTLAYAAPDDGYGWRTNFIFESGWVAGGAVRMSAKRTQLGDVCQIRSPLLDGLGNPARGVGLGMFAFEYANAQTNVNLLLQIVTNQTATAKGIDESRWVTVTNFDFSAMSELERAKGNFSVYLGLHGVQGLMRLKLDDAIVKSVTNTMDTTAFGEIDVTRVFCRDEPEVDNTCWWGWNLRMSDESPHQYLPDATVDAQKRGLTLALNNSVTADVRTEDKELYKQHMPFVQTPTFTSGLVGEVSFRARKYDLASASQKAEVRVYGAKSGDISEDKNWIEVAHFVVTNSLYATYTFRAESGTSYRAFRFGVSGVPGVPIEDETTKMPRGESPTCGSEPVRVLIDEVLVSQAVYPTMGFKYITPIRSELSSNKKVETAGERDEQPLFGESWSVQAEIEVRQLPDEIDLKTPSRRPRVLFRYYSGLTPWGYDNWSEKGTVAELVRADGEDMVFRGGFSKAPKAVVGAALSGQYQVVQYSADIVYYSLDGVVHTNTLASSEWTRPDWYYPLDYNATMGPKWNNAFAAYNILDSIAPQRVWVNEANVYDGRDSGFEYLAKTNQYIEIAAPMSQSLDGWRLDYISSQTGQTNTLCTFGADDVSSVKTINATNEYVFFVVQSPLTKAAGTLSVAKGEVDGTWQNFDGNGGELSETRAIALRLVRPSQIVEEEIVLEGTNSWASSAYRDRFSAATFVTNLNNYAGGKGRWHLVGNEYGSLQAQSLGVTNFIGETAADWSNRMKKTPGRVNVGQIVPEDYIIYPSGDLLVVYSTVDPNGHIRQTFGLVTNSLEAAMGVAAKGLDGTNITYDVDLWWEVKSLTTNGIPAPDYAGKTGRFVFTAGAGQSNNIDVIALAQPREDIREYLGENNRYEAAILDWLAKGKRYDGTSFENPGEIQLGWYWPYSDKAENRKRLSLTETYWLDIDPTSSNWVFQAGVCQAPQPLTNPTEHPDIRIGYYMAITNIAKAGLHSGVCYSPYILRGLTPGETSHDYYTAQATSWTSVTFKVTGDIQNNMPERKRWIPLRWFVFTPSSFDADHKTVVDILNPYAPDSAGAAEGWLDYEGTQVWYMWDIDQRLTPVTVEDLKTENPLHDQP